MARQFLIERGFDGTAAEHFGNGYAPRDGEALLTVLRQKGFSDEESVASGLVADRPVGVRPVPRAAAVADPRRVRRHHRLRRAPDPRRRQDRGEVPQHPRDGALQEEPGALRHRPRPPRHGPQLAGGRGRGLHRRDGLPPGRGAHRRRDLRHRLRRRPRPRAAPLPARPRGVPRRGDLHLRRRRGRAEGGAARRSAATRTSSPRPTSPSSPRAWTRATCGSRRATPRCASWSPAGSRSTASCSSNIVTKYDLDRADGRVDAVREGARLVSSIRDRSKVDAFSRELAGMIGVDVEQAREEVRRAGNRASRPAAAAAARRAAVGRCRAATRAAPRPA